MKILLINPAPSGTLKATGVLFPPLGLLYIAAYAEKEGHQVVVRDSAGRKKKEDIVFKKYDIVGISTDTTRHRQALQLAKRAKVSGCTVVMGGLILAMWTKKSFRPKELISSSVEKGR